MMMKATGCLNADKAIHTVGNSALTESAGNSHRASSGVRPGFGSVSFEPSAEGHIRETACLHA